ncbi:5-amino-6-(D-ribitylamino)uracil--L-tyrosine 4-hydroxyphenyl transferase CofH [Salipiger sp. P9]|uniref:5-amino-6-(D-ribitylamino)uracil--L-tyrosine 4-hydroxyphenyl transferase CofH n=1 Tax=Salipiger pentaromativorans TaxID=2943193 RepID=UPI00215722A6|nr:5-amino-6-(D-ribitylamino)uracil--L-tyrosine 4-hydroxyphenyl transferase CofH [Salipiger pentaromativorans]MCR8547514.1 5-amino-6-(D-ribitylamino)uracil--L-tyrosine 4-hydroxyphenyl transferase CofH [Salipiger pentaromativorans]
MLNASLTPDSYLSPEAALALAGETDLAGLIRLAGQRRDLAHRDVVSYSRKVFIPLTQLCRDVCGYCTFAKTPRKLEQAFLSFDQIREIARAGVAAGCREALFTLGDKPELRYRIAAEELARMGYDSTLDYLRAAAEMVFREFGLLPHVNPGLMSRSDMTALRQVSASQGIMLESVSPRLMQRGGAHFGAPDKDPELRLATIRLAGELQIPFTTGILSGIGETREERIRSLLALRALHEEYGHIQEIIVQNFQPKPGTRMAATAPQPLEDHLWTIAVARLIFAPEMSIQAPPNLSAEAMPALIDAGINDWGGVSPVTPDHVNPEKPWPHLEVLARRTEECGKVLVERLALYPSYALDRQRWVDPGLQPSVIRSIDMEGYARTDAWSPGRNEDFPITPSPVASALRRSPEIAAILARAQQGETLSEAQVVRLFQARGGDFEAVLEAANALRQEVNGERVGYVITRNINYTNICSYRCKFCAFSKGKTHEALRGKPYNLSLDEIAERTRDAARRGATEVCMQGGIHPDYTGETYLQIVRSVKAAVPGMHVHALSPLEVWQGAQTLGISLEEFLVELSRAGLSSLPGTAAEILDDEVRRELCADKLTTAQWFEVVDTAHRVGLKTTATIMFGHMERLEHWARHLLRLRAQQEKTGGFTELVPLPFVHMEAPIYLKGGARRGPSAREALLMHAVGRLALHPVIPNIQASWVKMGLDGLSACLRAGANDLGGSLMEETISRAAGAAHGQEVTAMQFEELGRRNDRQPYQRTTTYGEARGSNAGPRTPDLLGLS